MRIFLRRSRRLLAASTTLVALQIAGVASAQYAPYQTTAQQPYTPPGSYPAYSQTSPAAVIPAQAVTPSPATTTNTPTPGYVSPQPYPSPYGVPHTAMAYQNSGQAVENPPLTSPIESVVPATPVGGVEPAQVAPMAESYPPSPAVNGGYESYPSAAAAAGYGSGGNYSTYGCETPGSMGHLLGRGAGCGYWFGGVYGLLMDRDNSNKYALAFTAPTMPPGGYPAPTDAVVLNTRDTDIGYQGGVEFRLGRTFGCGPMDPCGCNTSCGPRWGLEGVYWTLFEDDDTAMYVDQGTLRTYTMMPMYGLEYDPGTGYRPVNEYWDHAPPAQTNDIEIRLARVRSSFELQNVELNLLRLSMCGNACGQGAMCNVGCDSGCDSCAGGGCATGYGAGLGSGWGLSRFSCTGVCGLRYLQFDESFMYGVDFENTTNGNTGFLNYWSTVENSLIGAQLGCNGMYRIGCKWGLHLNSSFGLYGNDIDVRQYMVSPTGQVRYIGTGEDFDVTASKTDVSMLGELRLGVSYQATCRCRLYGGWRAIGVSGIALATDQTPNQFLNATQMSNYVNSNGSMIVNGLQAGIEWNY